MTIDTSEITEEEINEMTEEYAKKLLMKVIKKLNDFDLDEFNSKHQQSYEIPGSFYILPQDR